MNLIRFETTQRNIERKFKYTPLESGWIEIVHSQVYLFSIKLQTQHIDSNTHLMH